MMATTSTEGSYEGMSIEQLRARCIELERALARANARIDVLCKGRDEDDEDEEEDDDDAYYAKHVDGEAIQRAMTYRHRLGIFVKVAARGFEATWTELHEARSNLIFASRQLLTEIADCVEDHGPLRWLDRELDAEGLDVPFEEDDDPRRLSQRIAAHVVGMPHFRVNYTEPPAHDHSDDVTIELAYLAADRCPR